MIRIAIAGNDGTGKSTLATTLGKLYSVTHVNLAFADGIRQELEAKGLSHQALYDKPTSPRIRRLLKAWGTYKRIGYEGYWVDKLALTIGKDSATIGDMRFRVEAEWAKANGFLIVMLGEPEGYELSDVSYLADLFLPPKPDFETYREIINAKVLENQANFVLPRMVV